MKKNDTLKYINNIIFGYFSDKWQHEHSCCSFKLFKYKKLAPILTKIAHDKLEEQKLHKGETTNQFEIGNDKNGHNNAISIQAEQSNNVIIINEPMAIIQMLKKVIHQLDVRPD